MNDVHAPLNPLVIVNLMSRKAPRGDVLWAAAFVCVLGGLMVAAIRFGSARGPAVEPFVPICASLWAAADLLTAYLLLTQFTVNGMRAFAVLAGAYICSGALTVPYLWFFPGLFFVVPLAPGFEQVSLWLWVCWHLTFPVLIASYQRFDTSLGARITSGAAVRRMLIGVVVVCAAGCTVVVSVVVSAHARLPLLLDGPHFTPLFTEVFAPAVVATNLLAAILMLTSKRPSRLQLWLGVALISAALDAVLNAVATARYSATWYVGKIETLAASATVLMVLLSEIGILYRRLGGLATIDALTGLSNRQAFDTDARFALQMHQRRAEGFAFVVIDIDFFKQYNDTYGHQAGDDCLRSVAASIRQSCARSVDLVGRFGGEEFVALLPDTNAAGAMLVAEAVRRNVEALGIAHAASSVASVVTVSVGVVQTAQREDVELEMLFRKADAALYSAKVRRNAVVKHESDDPAERKSAGLIPATIYVPGTIAKSTGLNA